MLAIAHGSRYDFLNNSPGLLAQNFGALTFYMANRDLVDRHLSEGVREFETLRQEARRNNPMLYAKLAEARRRSQTPSA